MFPGPRSQSAPVWLTSDPVTSDAALKFGSVLTRAGLIDIFAGGGKGRESENQQPLERPREGAWHPFAAGPKAESSRDITALKA